MIGDYKKQIISALIVVFVGLALPGIVMLHNAYADDRYIQKAESIRFQIQQVDNALFEIDQEIAFSETDKDRAKWQARRQYYLREKAKLKELLEAGRTAS